MIDPNEAPAVCYACAPEGDALNKCLGCAGNDTAPIPDNMFCLPACSECDRQDGENVIFKSLELTEREKRLMVWAYECGNMDIADIDGKIWLSYIRKNGAYYKVLKGIR